MGKPVDIRLTSNFKGQAGNEPYNREQIRSVQLARAMPESNSDATSGGNVTVDSRMNANPGKNGNCSPPKMVLGNMAISLCLSSKKQALQALNSAPFPEVIRDLLLRHAIEGDAACEMMLACVGLPETEREGASPSRFSTCLQPLLEGGRP